jgi:hypothetical protein
MKEGQTLWTRGELILAINLRNYKEFVAKTADGVKNRLQGFVRNHDGGSSPRQGFNWNTNLTCDK